MKTSKTYIIAWDGAIDNCIDISSQLLEGQILHTFYNVSGKENQSPYWETKDDIRYYNHFFNAVKNFLSTEHDVFIFNSGDIQYDKYAQYTRRIERLFNENELLAVFAPNSTNNIYSGWGSLIEDSKKYPNMYLSTNTDGLYTSMSREMVTYMSRFYDWSIETKSIDFSTMTSGWGLDHVYCSLAIYLNKIIYRDRSVVVYHPVGQSYVQDIAIQEFYQTIRAFLTFAQEVLGFDSDRLKYIINQTIGKIKDNNRLPLGIETMYTNLEVIRNV
jgi:hypothetical protein